MFSGLKPHVTGRRQKYVGVPDHEREGKLGSLIHGHFAVDTQSIHCQRTTARPGRPTVQP